MKKLNEKVWDVFEIGKIFKDIEPTKGRTTADLVAGNNLPYIAAAKVNNGFAGMYSRECHEDWVSKGNGILFVQLGDGAAGLSYYIPMDFVGMRGKTSIGYFDALNQNNGLFLANCLSVNKAIFSHGYSWTGNRLIRTKVMLPVGRGKKPDYKYMEEYTLSKRKELLSRYKAFVKKQMLGLEYSKILPLSEKEWDSFELGNLAKIYSGQDIYAQERKEGNIPYITSGASNNGVGYFVGNDNNSKAKNSISVNRNGAVGEAFYHPYEALYGNDCRRVSIEKTKDFGVQLFFTMCISLQKKAFSYSRKLGTERLKKLQIMLPIDENGEPDYEYMEKYAKNMMLKKYKQYLEFLNKHP